MEARIIYLVLNCIVGGYIGWSISKLLFFKHENKQLRSRVTYLENKIGLTENYKNTIRTKYSNNSSAIHGKDDVRKVNRLSGPCSITHSWIDQKGLLHVGRIY